MTPDGAIRFAAAVCAHPAAAVARWKALTGAKAVGCLPIYLPEEIVDGAGMLPVTLWGDEEADPALGAPPFACSVARNVLGAARGRFLDLLDAFAVPSTCDILQGLADLLKACGDPRPLFRLDLAPSGDPPGEAVDLLDRIEAFREWAGEVSGRAVRDGAIEKSIRTGEENRRLLGRLEERMAGAPGDFSAREYLSLVRSAAYLPRAAHLELLREALSRRRRGARGRKPRARVFLSGMMATAPVMDALDTAGGAVVGEDLARGHRSFATSVPAIGDPAVALVLRHLGRGPCPTLHRAGRSGRDHLFSRASACGADRLLALRILGCERDGGDLSDLEAEAAARGFPFLCAELNLSAPAPSDLADRVAAFVAGRA